MVDDTNHSIQVFNPYKPESRRHFFKGHGPEY
jgi:hypothetical protein